MCKVLNALGAAQNMISGKKLRRDTKSENKSSQSGAQNATSPTSGLLARTGGGALPGMRHRHPPHNLHLKGLSFGSGVV